MQSLITHNPLGLKLMYRHDVWGVSKERGWFYSDQYHSYVQWLE